MLINLLIFIGGTLVDFFCAALLIRFVMQAVRLTFINPLGRFILAVTEWCVRPVRRWIPRFRGVDISPLVLAWLIQCLWLVVRISDMPTFAITAVMGVATLEVLRLLLHLAMGIIIVSAVLSWVNPYAPLAPLFNALSRPLLRPLRAIPPVGGVDISPLVLLLCLQIILGIIDSLRFGLLPGLR